ncbi:rRNA maturation RNase YbeY [Neolewinella aurantiaca]|uniref:Endoribonuclease YbeY n=1 Tax=Neolewinella aurantiaca TaxID=2602767 RepID=A0A5C7FKU8_9BACT|nr:rRNA maturation RNase YbeY [Neolewinella aurantiaca]TXF90625.1 rRNA maturation RNase YbeY [Neolewinella aurantiaca]
MASEILFHTEEGGNPPAEGSWQELRTWIVAVITQRGGKASAINYIFCGDNYLHQMNVEYLDHDTLTDIITFPYEAFPLVSGDLFISTERVADNASDLGSSYTDELHRVIIHGILHLCGQGDKTDEEAKEMRELEDRALSLRPASLLIG